MKRVTEWERRMETADQEQSHLLHEQWSLVKEQISSMTRDIVDLRQDFSDLEEQLGVQSRSLDVHKASQDEHRGMLQKALQRCDQDLREELGRVTDDHGELRGHLEEHRENLERLKDGHGQSMKELDAAIRRELADKHNDHSAQHSRALQELDEQVKQQLEQLAKDHSANHSVASASLAALDKQLRNEVARLGDSGPEVALYGQTYDSASTRRRCDARLAKQVVLESTGSHDKHRQDIDQIRSELREAVQRCDRDLREEIGRMKDDYRELRGYFDDHRGHLDRVSGGHVESMKDLDTAIRKEFAQKQDDHSAQHMRALQEFDQQMKKDLQQLAQDHSSNHNSAKASLAAPDEQLRRELDMQLELDNSTLQDMLSSHKADMQRKLEDLNSRHDDDSKDLRARQDKQRIDMEQFRSEVVDSSGVMDMLQKHTADLERQIALVTSQHIKDLRSKHQKHRGEIDQFRGNIDDALERCDQELRAELGSLKNENGTLRGQIEANRGNLQRLVDGQTQSIQELEAVVRRELAQSQADNSAQQSRALQDLEHQVKLQLDQIAIDHSTNKGNAAASLAAMDEQLRRKVASFDSSGLQDMFHAHKADMEKRTAHLDAKHDDHANDLRTKHDKHRKEVDQFRRELQEALARCDRDLRTELACVKSDQGAALRGHLDNHRGQLQGLTEGHAQSMKELEAALRRELAQKHDDHSAQHRRSLQELDQQVKQQMELLAKDNSSSHSAAKASLAALDEQLRCEIGRLDNSGLQGMFHGHKADMERQMGQVASLQAKHSDHAKGLWASIERHFESERRERETLQETVLARVASSDRGLRQDLAQAIDDLSSGQRRLMEAANSHKGEHKDVSQTALDALEAQLKRDLKRVAEDSKAGRVRVADLFEEHKDSVDKALGAERALREDQRNELLGQYYELDKALRKEVARVNDDHSTWRSELLDNRMSLGKHLKQAVEEQSQELADHRTHLQKHLTSNLGSFHDVLEQEKAERVRHQADLQGRIDRVETSLAASRQQPAPGVVLRNELDPELLRVWEALRSHTHNVPQAQRDTILETVHAMEPVSSLLERPPLLATVRPLSPMLVSATPVTSFTPLRSPSPMRSILSQHGVFASPVKELVNRFELQHCPTEPLCR